MKNFIALFIITALLPLNTISAAGREWGLYFREPGGTPEGDRTAEYLLEYGAFFTGNTDEKVLYLTFDAGYENGYTEAMLDVLKEKRVPAAFFVLGSYIKANPEIVRRMAAEGHTVGNHTMRHPDMTRLCKAGFINELGEAEKMYRENVGAYIPRFYRPPSGKYSGDNLMWAKELGYKTVFWSLAYVDWDADAQPSREKALGKLLPRLHPGAVILFHITNSGTPKMLKLLLPQIAEKGYGVGRGDEL